MSAGENAGARSSREELERRRREFFLPPAPRLHPPPERRLNTLPLHTAESMRDRDATRSATLRPARAPAEPADWIDWTGPTEPADARETRATAGAAVGKEAEPVWCLGQDLALGTRADFNGTFENRAAQELLDREAAAIPVSPGSKVLISRTSGKRFTVKTLEGPCEPRTRSQDLMDRLSALQRCGLRDSSIWQDSLWDEFARTGRPPRYSHRSEPATNR